MLTLAHGGESHKTTAAPERRRGLRIRQSRPVKVYEPRTSRYFPGRTADISANGLRLSLPLSVPVIPGSMLSLYIGMDRPGDMLAARRGMVDAKVVWARRDDHGPQGQLIVGLQLVENAAIQVDAA